MNVDGSAFTLLTRQSLRSNLALNFKSSLEKKKCKENSKFSSKFLEEEEEERRKSTR